MNKRKAIILLVTLSVILLMTGVALAMDSDNYQLDWFTPLTSGGGGAASSANYAINYTVGQTAVQVSSSTNYGVCLGYWCEAAEAEYAIFLPLVMRD